VHIRCSTIQNFTARLHVLEAPIVYEKFPHVVSLCNLLKQNRSCWVMRNFGRLLKFTKIRSHNYKSQISF